MQEISLTENIEWYLGAFDGVKFLDIALKYIKSLY